MSPKISTVRRNFAALQTPLICPLCRAALNLQDNSFRCSGGHCYDLSTKNYLNLAPQQKQLAIYDADFFSTRRRIFQAGFYAPLTQQIADICHDLQQQLGRPISVLDAGCGEGFFAMELLQNLGEDKAEIIALDLARDGVIMAAKACPGLKCVVGDLSALPIGENGADVILNILSPANYQEFARVLRPHGLLLKVIPGADYLRQVRQAYNLSPGLDSDAEKLLAAAVADYNTTRLTYTLPVTAAQAADLLKMSPLAHHHTATAADFNEITIDLQLLSARF
ncbi:MAG: methyltransferase domain-containing protein [Firmicutes bacterium]|nr:methyltransferase domain-containing protein [Bacillota bacterium]